MLTTHDLFENFLSEHQRTYATSATIVAIPPAGSGSSIFAPWRQELPREIELLAVRLPGRERLVAAAAVEVASEIVDMLASALDERNLGKFALYGECFGAILAFEVARALRRRGRRLPQHIFAIGQAAPHARRADQAVAALSGEEFFDAVRQRGGLREGLTYSHPLWQIMERSVRADFRAAASYTYTSEPPLDVPITAWRGSRDTHVLAAAVKSWGELTTSDFVYGELESYSHVLSLVERASLASKVVMHWRLSTTLEL